MSEQRPLALVSCKPRAIRYQPDYSWEVWTMNDGWRYCSRIDKLFEMHDWDWRKDKKGRHESYMSALKKMHTPIVMLKHYDDIPASVPYPIMDVESRVLPPGYRKQDLFSSTASYMIAMAILYRYQYIKLIGFNEMVDTVRLNLSFWMGLALGKGIQLTIEDAPAPFHSLYMYGYGESEYLDHTGKWDIGLPIETTD